MRIMAVTKTVPIERILPVLQAKGINLIGESRLQEAKTKLVQLPTAIEKHFIGHLQTNKVKEVVALFDCIETIDRLKLAEAVEQAAAAQAKSISIFLQVNVSRDPAKFGFLPEQLAHAIEVVKQYRHLRVDGLMTITAQQSVEQTRQDFKMMKQLQTTFGLKELSMGMSGDWELAQAEGATIIRLGRALFGERS